MHCALFSTICRVVISEKKFKRQRGYTKTFTFPFLAARVHKFPSVRKLCDTSQTSSNMF